ncbi:hypothetical protein BD770DRAFT_475285 [Pilaira anomala]|nr:hypothetical protein BD770DRAFT_475285 [Pilaira anomala]
MQCLWAKIFKISIKTMAYDPKKVMIFDMLLALFFIFAAPSLPLRNIRLCLRTGYILDKISN